MTLVSVNSVTFDKNSKREKAQRVITEFDPGSQVDAFGRLRVANQFALFEHDNRFDNGSSYFDSQVVNGATDTHNAQKVRRVLTTNTVSGSKAIRQTRRYIEYIKGKSQQIFLTGNWKGLVDNVSKKYGYFDDLNGIFFYSDGQEFGVCLRSSISGSVVDVKIPKSQWNRDKLDGSKTLENPSGASLDLTKEQFMFIDFGWLGIADIRIGFLINGIRHVCHIFQSSNILDASYSQSGTLPIRAEIENTAASAGSSLEITCMSVNAEALEDKQGKVYNTNTGTNEVNVNTQPQIIGAIRLNPATNRASIKPIRFDLLGTSGNSTMYWRILQNPAITGGVWTNLDRGLSQGLTSYTSFTGGNQLDSGYILIGQQTTVSDFQSDIFFGRSIAGVSDVLALEIRTISSNSKALFSGSWREYS